MQLEGGFRDDCEESQAAFKAAREIKKYIVRGIIYFAQNHHIEVNLNAKNAIKKYAELRRKYGHVKALF